MSERMIFGIGIAASMIIGVMIGGITERRLSGNNLMDDSASIMTDDVADGRSDLLIRCSNRWPSREVKAIGDWTYQQCLVKHNGEFVPETAIALGK